MKKTKKTPLPSHFPGLKSLKARLEKIQHLDNVCVFSVCGEVGGIEDDPLKPPQLARLARLSLAMHDDDQKWMPCYSVMV